MLDNLAVAKNLHHVWQCVKMQRNHEGGEVQAREKQTSPARQAEDGDRMAETQADGFQAVRDAHRSEIVEDYVELVAELIAASGEARPVDIATRMGVTQPTVAKNLARLKREGYITRERYRSVFLTETGRALAKECRRRHRIVLDFLRAQV